MAEPKKSTWDVSEALDKGYTVKALNDLRDKLIRSKAREMPMSEVAKLRQAEVDYVVGLINRVGG